MGLLTSLIAPAASRTASRTAAPVTASGMPVRRLQRACACQGGCDNCRKKRVQRRGEGPESSRDSGLPSAASDGFERGGQPLSQPLRARLEPLYRASFADVRIHNDAASHSAARGLNAQAFTVGQHLHFGARHYQPDSNAGLHLLAHELTHTVQQRGAATAPALASLEVDPPDTSLEREAETQADAVLAGRGTPLRAGSAGAGVQARLQRAPAGAASGGTGTAEREIDATHSTQVTRDVVAVPCTRADIKKEAVTRSSKVLFWDEQAQAVKARYQVCNGKVQLDTGTNLDVKDVTRAATDLMNRVGRDPTTAPDALRDAVNSATLSASGHISFSVSHTFDATLSGDSSAGAQKQTAQVKLRLLVNTASDKVQVIAEAGVGVSNTDITREVERFVGGQLHLGPVRIEIKYVDKSSTPAGGPTTSQGTLSERIETDIPGTGFTLGCTATQGGSGQPGTFTCGPGGTIGKPDKPPAVNCYECSCPAPKTDYRCRSIVKQHTEPVETQAHDKQRIKLFYMFDSDAPDPQQDFEPKIVTIAGLSKSGYKINEVAGFASPEANRSYNKALGARRARHALGRIAAQPGVNTAALPQALGQGEDEALGASSTREGKEASDKDLVAEMSARLKAQPTEDARLELLGIDDAKRKDPKLRAQVLADIDAFIDGKDAAGKVLKQRARWEKVFPHLRRVEVEVERPKLMGVKDVDASDVPGDCTQDDRAFIDAKLGPLPPEKRVPADC